MIVKYNGELRVVIRMCIDTAWLDDETRVSPSELELIGVSVGEKYKVKTDEYFFGYPQGEILIVTGVMRNSVLFKHNIENVTQRCRVDFLWDQIEPVEGQLEFNELLEVVDTTSLNTNVELGDIMTYVGTVEQTVNKVFYHESVGFQFLNEDYISSRLRRLHDSWMSSYHSFHHMINNLNMDHSINVLMIDSFEQLILIQQDDGRVLMLTYDIDSYGHCHTEVEVWIK